ncbi:hypothetical protein D3C80_1725210 [compost metagenome]
MLAGTAGAEVVDHGLQIGEGRGAVGPDVSPVGFLLARREHLHRGFVSVDHALAQHGLALMPWLMATLETVAPGCRHS